MADDEVHEVPSELSFVLPRWALAPLEGVGPLPGPPRPHGAGAAAGRGHGGQLQRRAVHGRALHARRWPGGRGGGQPRAGRGRRWPTPRSSPSPWPAPASAPTTSPGGPDRAGHVVRALRHVHGRAAVGRGEPGGVRQGDEDARAVGFDEGDKHPDWPARLQARGIEVVRDIRREEAAAILRRYAAGGGVIYNGMVADPPARAGLSGARPAALRSADPRHEAPTTVEAALAALKRHGPAARPVAGDRPAGRAGPRRAARRRGVIDLTRIAGLDRIEGRRWASSASAAWSPTTRSSPPPLAVDRALPLAQACLEIGSPALRNRATVAGNLVTASPANDTVSTRCGRSTRSSSSGPAGAARSVPVRELFTGLRRTVIEPGELVVDRRGADADQQRAKDLREAGAASRPSHLGGAPGGGGWGATATVQTRP